MKPDAVNNVADDDRGFADSAARESLPGRLDDLRDRLEVREAELDLLRTRIAELEQESADRDALRQQAEQALAITRRRFSRLLDENATYRNEASTVSELQRLESDLREVESALGEARHKLALTESTLQQRREESSQAWNEVSATRAQIKVLEAELKKQTAINSQLEFRVADAEAWAFKLAGERRSAEIALAGAEQALVKEREERERAELSIGVLQSNISYLQENLEAAETDRKAAEARRDEAYNEIVTITRFLRSSESIAAQNEARLDWITRVADVMNSKAPWWFRLLPSFLNHRRRMRRLAAMQLFDAAAYLRRHPDVRAAGQDPLRHYILHGMAEGRQI
jgi:chromosome segregation ATPase